MQRAQELNPGHEETMKQLWNLERALEQVEQQSATHAVVDLAGEDSKDLNAQRLTLDAHSNVPSGMDAAHPRVHRVSAEPGGNTCRQEVGIRRGQEGTNDEEENEAFAEIIKLCRMPLVSHPLVYGRDASNPYYDFLYRLVENYKPRLVVELGTCTGGSTSYLAAANPDTRVISVDIIQHPEVAKRLSAFPNVELWTYDTRDPAFKERLENEGPIDVLFIDTEHTYAQARAEFELFSKLVSQEGFILFDDIEMSGVSKFWKELPCKKSKLNRLHWSGFGIVSPYVARQ